MLSGRVMKTTTWMVCAGLCTAALTSGCGGAPGDGVSTPGTIGAPDDPTGRPENGTSRGDGTGVSAGDHDKTTNDNDPPKPEKPPQNSGPGPR